MHPALRVRPPRQRGNISARGIDAISGAVGPSPVSGRHPRDTQRHRLRTRHAWIKCSAGRFLCAILMVSICVRADEPRRKQSPFLPPDTPAAAPAAAPPAHEFSGVIVAGSSVLVNIADVQARRSTWITVGQSADGIDAVSYDPKTENVVVRIAKQTKTLTLKKPTVAAHAGPVLATVAVAPTVPLPPPSSPAEAEREARMLVSDLLEIGMAQRKAYEEAQRKAAAEAASGKAAPPSSPANPK